MTFRARAAQTSQVVLDRLPAPVRNGFRRHRDVFRGLVQLKRNQAMLARRVAELEGAVGVGCPVAAEPADAWFPPGIRSKLCSQAQLREPWYQDCCAKLGELPGANRKQWERAYIVHTLDCLGMLEPGRRGVGFGVGREPLVALFAGRGCEIVATDLPSTAREARPWVKGGQHGDLDDLMRPDLCPPPELRRLVSVRAVDMRSVPTDLAGFDFCWSACSLEHLGSLEAGMEFVQQAMGTLMTGGVAVHTTEFNVASDDATIDSGLTVLYRRRDLEALETALKAAGHHVAALCLDRGREVLDEYVDVPPYVDEPHLTISLKGHATTSVALVVRADAASDGRPRQ